MFMSSDLRVWYQLHQIRLQVAGADSLSPPSRTATPTGRRRAPTRSPIVFHASTRAAPDARRPGSPGERVNAMISTIGSSTTKPATSAWTAPLVLSVQGEALCSRCSTEATGPLMDRSSGCIHVRTDSAFTMGRAAPSWPKCRTASPATRAKSARRLLV